MKTIKSFTFFLIVLLLSFSGNVQSTVISKTNGEKTTVYYFHNTRRCPTCMAIEKETKKVLNDSFTEAVENGDIVFKSINAEDEVNKELVKELKVTGSALIVVQGKKKTDLTTKGFMYALKEPEKLRQALRDVLNE